MPKSEREGGETVPIKWSALQLSLALDEIQEQVDLAAAYLIEARAKARKATNIDNLPVYVGDLLDRLIPEIARIERIKAAIKAVRDAIPEEAIEAEREKLKLGSQQSLEL